MSRGLRWTEEEMSKRGWKDPKGVYPVSQANRPEVLEAQAKLNKLWNDALDGPQTTQKPRQRTRKPSKAIPYERDVLKAVLAALRAHPRVAWAVRLNSGMAMLPGRGGKPQPVRFGFEGCPDIIGQIRIGSTEPNWCYAGAFLAVEVKRPGKKPTLAQAAFLLRVRESGGVGFVADSVDSVWEHLGKP